MDSTLLYWSYYNSIDVSGILPYEVSIQNRTPPEPPITGTEILYLGQIPEEFEYIEYKD